MRIAEEVAKQSTCLSRQVGAVLRTRTGFIASANRVPYGVERCMECRRRKMGFKSGEGLQYSRALHAEVLVILKSGVNAYGATLYVTHTPCLDCAKVIVESGVSRVVYKELYPNAEETIRLLNSVGIITEQMG